MIAEEGERVVGLELIMSGWKKLIWKGRDAV